jgi:membrane protease YdiL (CAAX protease family)
MDPASARRGLALYLGIVVLLSGAIEATILLRGGPIDSHPLLVVALMWSPTLAMVVTRLARREGFADVAFALRGPGTPKMLAIVWAYPIVVGLVGYGIAWGTGLEQFHAPERALVGAGAPPLLRFAISIGLNATLGTVLSAITATGEELGWRGYMVPRLVHANVPRPLLVSGLVWGAWHLPLIVSGQYAAGRYPLLCAAMFLVSIVAASYVVGRARLESGSVWPAVAFHSAWNAIIQGTFDRYTAGGDASHGSTLWTGEGGVLVAASSAVVALALMVRPWPVRARPRGEPLRALGIGSA